MENTDVGEHEDVDVKNERLKVFNLMNSTAVQEPPVVLVQVRAHKIFDEFPSLTISNLY